MNLNQKIKSFKPEFGNPDHITIIRLLDQMHVVKKQIDRDVQLRKMLFGSRTKLKIIKNKLASLLIII